MPGKNKPRPNTNLYSGITSSAGIMENASANSRIQATTNKIQGGGGRLDLQHGHTYPDNNWPFACKDPKTGKITTLFNPETGFSISRSELKGLKMNYGQIISKGRIRKPKITKKKSIVYKVS